MTKYHKLTVLATPIGNLAEISDLAKQRLMEAKIIVCEDTRVTKKLLNLLHLSNNQKLISYNKISEKEKTEKILTILQQQPCVLVSDAGYPVISDPGFHLINYLRKQNATLEIVNGPCALIHALVGSGIDSRKFFFANFLTKKRVQRTLELNELKIITQMATVIYYEPLNFIEKGLEILAEVFGNIKIGIARELSKMNETFYFDHISILKNKIELKGEFVVIIPKQEKTIMVKDNETEILLKIQDLLNEKISLKSACKFLANDHWKASEIYKLYLTKKDPK